jgi:hypothetical protein
VRRWLESHAADRCLTFQTRSKPKHLLQLRLDLLLPFPAYRPKERMELLLWQWINEIALANRSCFESIRAVQPDLIPAGFATKAEAGQTIHHSKTL